MLKSVFATGLVAAMEDGEPEVVADEVEVGADSAEAAVAETTEGAAVVSDASTQIEAAQNDADALDSIIETVESTEAEGGMDPVAATVAEVAVESIFQRLGIKKKPVASLESFSNKTGRLRATHVAVEDWKAQVKRVWAAIVEAFRKVVDYVVSFFRTLFDSAAKLSARAVALKNGLKAKAGQSAKEAEIGSGGFVKKLATSKGFDAAGAISGVAEVSKVVGGDSASLDLSAAWGNLVKDKGAFEAFALPKAAGASLNDKKAPEGFEWKGESDLPGNKTIAILVPVGDKKGAEAVAAMRSVKVEITDTNPKLEVKDEKVPTLTLDQIGAMADAVITTAKGLNGQKAIEAKLNGELKNFINEADSIAKLGDSKEDEGLGTRSKAVSGAAAAATNAMVKKVTLAFAHALTTAQAGLDYAEKSLKQYETKKEEPAAK